VFSRRRWFKGLPIAEIGLEDIAWFLPEGIEMTEDIWRNDFAKSLAVYLNGHALRTQGPKGETIIDDSFYIIFNAHYESLNYKIPVEKYGNNWLKVIDTSQNFICENGKAPNEVTDLVCVQGRSVLVLKQPRFQKNI
jgi:glycogen operon protein